MADPDQVRTGRPLKRTLGVLFLGVLVLAAVGFVGLSAFGLWTYMNVDHLGIIDDPAVSEPASRACDTLAAAVAALPPGPTVGVVRGQDAAIRDLIETMEALGTKRLKGDDPAVDWVADWRTLLRLREAYADQLEARNQPTLDLPKVDGIPINERMSDPGLSCPVATQLAAPPVG